jgi:hypothetical protein
MYRLRSNTSSVFRVGSGYRYDDTRIESPLYYTPQNFNVLSVLADYQVTQRRLNYGVSASYPLSNDTGEDGINRPARTLFGFLNYDLNELIRLYLNGGVVDAPNFDSTEFALGANVWF